MIEDLAGVIFWTDNLEEMARFYREALRLPVHSDHGDFVAFQVRPGMRLSIGKHSKVRGRAKDPYRITVNLRVADIQKSYRALMRRGVQFIRPPEAEEWGGWVATFQDPDGNLLQLFQFTERGVSSRKAPEL
ncbi:MAG: hypothetical protein EXR48_02845 [Dehalococcoidia bacterium]|nr:hypothetical protein [Dehalococcoidia bacterium]